MLESMGTLTPEEYKAALIKLAESQVKAIHDMCVKYGIEYDEACYQETFVFNGNKS